MKTKMLSALCALLATSAFADVSLNRIFSDHMVLQRDRVVPVWGKAAPGESVSVRFGGRTLSARADAKGRWEVKLPAMKWNATAQELSVQGAKNEVVVKDVLVGDVWLVSGQSNSEMTFGWGIINGEEEKAKAEKKMLNDRFGRITGLNTPEKRENFDPFKLQPKNMEEKAIIYLAAKYDAELNQTDLELEDVFHINESLRQLPFLREIDLLSNNG